MADFQPSSPGRFQRRPDKLKAPLAVSPPFAGKSEFLDLVKKLESLSLSAADQKEFEGLLLSLREAYLGPHQKATMPGQPLETGQQVPLAEAPMSKGADSAGKSAPHAERLTKPSRGETMSDLNTVLAKNLTAQLESVQQPVQEKPLPASQEPSPRKTSTPPAASTVGLEESGQRRLAESLSILDSLDQSVGMLGIGVLSERANAQGLLAELRKRLSKISAPDYA